MKIGHYESGQSITEFVVSFAVLIPVLIMIPTLANMLSVQTEAHKASRYVAWERTAYSENTLKTLKTDAKLAGEVRQRFIDDAESGFGTAKSGNVRQWRDFGNPQSSVMDLKNQAIKVDSTAAQSATADLPNASAWMAGRGGSNAVTLDTLRNSRLSIPISSDNSLLQMTKPLNFWFDKRQVGNNTDVPYDEVAKTKRFYVASSSAMITDGWMSVNEDMFSDRVSDINRGSYKMLRVVESPALLMGLFGMREINDHLIVDPAGYRASLDMVDPQQSTNLPAALKEYQ